MQPGFQSEFLSWICLQVRGLGKSPRGQLYPTGLAETKMRGSPLLLNFSPLHHHHWGRCWTSSRAETMLKNIILFEADIVIEARRQGDRDFAVLDRTFALLWQAATVIPLSQRTRAEGLLLQELCSLVPEKQGSHRFAAVSGDEGRQPAVDLTLYSTSGSWLTDKKGGTGKAE